MGVGSSELQSTFRHLPIRRQAIVVTTRPKLSYNVYDFADSHTFGDPYIVDEVWHMRCSSPPQDTNPMGDFLGEFIVAVTDDVMLHVRDPSRLYVLTSAIQFDWS